MVPWLVVGAEWPPRGAALLKTDLMGVFAHPDDEVGMAATVARYALGEGKGVAHVYATRGEGGGNMVGTHWGPALGVLREAELRDCLRLLGVRYTYFLDQTDFFYTESLEATLRVWDREEALRRLVRLVRALRPEIIATMNPAPRAGQHGHHQAAGVLATEAFAAAADPGRFPEQLADEGLGIWQARRLVYGGVQGRDVVHVGVTDPLPDGRIPADVAGEALSHHRSQGFGGFAGAPWLRRPQAFTLVKNAVAHPSAAFDLFAGLPAFGPLAWADPGPAPGRPLVAFVPRPSIVRYREWAREQGLEHLGAEFPADLPVVAGEGNLVEVEVAPEVPDVVLTGLKWEGPEGWGWSGLQRGGEPGRWRMEVVPPEGALGSAAVRLRGAMAGKSIEAEARLHAVPRARVPRVPEGAMTLGPGAHWEGGALLEIGPDRVWQGQVADAADHSARVRVAHGGETLWVEVLVRDDVVVSNIAPDDIRGHWRSDSVEICVDPAAGAGDTTGTLKVGIFPFDTSGRVRAARDADARQGPVEWTAPGLRLASARMPDGYRVAAAIPLALITDGGPVPGRLGFNVLVYDGDKRDAAPGENINKSRLAWAPRAGVQGRPEDWGRIDLE